MIFYGALGIGIGDKLMMMENTWYSVISPESCSSILWRSWDHKEKAAEALKLTPDDMLQRELIDSIIKEPLGGAHRDHDKAAKAVKKEIKKSIEELSAMEASERCEARINKFTKMGIYKEAQ